MTKVIALIRLRRVMSVNFSFLLGLGLILQHDLTKSALAQKAKGLDLYAKTSTIWLSSVIPVCWENPSGNFNTEMNWVKTATESAWGSVSAVNFVNWGACNSTSQGIRIQINDEGPHTKGLGSQLNGVKNGMVLNFTFQNWSASCQSDRERCIKVIAVHEFGHSLGFAHEQVRPDTPSNCTAEKQGSSGDLLIGAWDLDSVMNYCNPNWSGGGNLSNTDIIGVQRTYGLGLPISLNAVNFSSEGVGNAVGNGGLILRTGNGGTSWVRAKTPVSTNLNSVHFTSELVGNAVGDGGVILRTGDGGTWVRAKTPVSTNLNSVHFTSELVGNAVGDGGVILRTGDGGTWVRSQSGVSTKLNSVHFTSEMVGNAVGDGGVILRTGNGGASWVRLQSGVSSNLNSVHFSSERIGNITGDGGVILRTGDGGASWVRGDK
jgi:photosystem II stability/assembly factor-like uncharacterized protein